MKLDDFNKTLAQAAPPDDVAGALAGLWWAAKGDWDTSHKIVQDDESRDAAWVHAYLHRVEGDLPNASYWYRTAGKPVATGALDTEWSAIAAALLGKPSVVRLAISSPTAAARRPPAGRRRC